MDDMPSVATELVKASPAVSVGALTIFGVSFPDMVQIAVLVYTMGLIAQQAYRLRRWWIDRKRRQDEADSAGA